MPRRDEQPIALRVTDEQKAWLQREAKRLERPMAWIIRKAIDRAMNTTRQHDNRPQELAK